MHWVYKEHAEDYDKGVGASERKGEVAGHDGRRLEFANSDRTTTEVRRRGRQREEERKRNPKKAIYPPSAKDDLIPMLASHACRGIDQWARMRSPVLPTAKSDPPT